MGERVKYNVFSGVTLLRFAFLFFSADLRATQDQDDAEAQPGKKARQFIYFLWKKNKYFFLVGDQRRRCQQRQRQRRLRCSSRRRQRPQQPRLKLRPTTEQQQQQQQRQPAPFLVQRDRGAPRERHPAHAQDDQAAHLGGRHLLRLLAPAQHRQHRHGHHREGQDRRAGRHTSDPQIYRFLRKIFEFVKTRYQKKFFKKFKLLLIQGKRRDGSASMLTGEQVLTFPSK